MRQVCREFNVSRTSMTAWRDQFPEELQKKKNGKNRSDSKITEQVKKELKNRKDYKGY